jgi:hypothetical protein
MIMNEDKIITIRFKLGNTQDMELYREIECEKNCLGMSMPAYIKGVLQEHFARKPSGNMEEELLWMLKDEMDQYQKNIQGMIREELMSLSSIGNACQNEWNRNGCVRNYHKSRHNHSEVYGGFKR